MARLVDLCAPYEQSVVPPGVVNLIGALRSFAPGMRLVERKERRTDVEAIVRNRLALAAEIGAREKSTTANSSPERERPTSGVGDLDPRSRNERMLHPGVHGRYVPRVGTHARPPHDAARRQSERARLGAN
jgi:hypothetical protein